ncbi:hypothetical protein V2J09_006788, partial [Rumex salicifolius]
PLGTLRRIVLDPSSVVPFSSEFVARISAIDPHIFTGKECIDEQLIPSCSISCLQFVNLGGDSWLCVVSTSNGTMGSSCQCLRLVIIVAINWDRYRLCKHPLHIWIVVDYTTIFFFRLLMFVDNGLASGMGFYELI